ncbi:nuclear receptor coactivator 5 isoform X2 [Pseudophryne corroboree]|uniref:nuclear receptor coactivator 5 isoform X2 n=1 Tax=Pseudophryne corroboree TaxID=495146 RepID=UPI003081DDDD
MSRGKNKKAGLSGNRTDSEDPNELDRRIFVGNLPTSRMTKKEMEEMFSRYGKISALTMLHGYGFVQYERQEDADAAVIAENGRIYKGYRLDIKKAAEGRKMNKAQSRSSPSRRELYTYGDSQEPRRDRSPLRSSPRRDREPRDNRDSRTARETREPREQRDIRDTLESRDVREGHNSREVRDARELRELRDPRDIRDAREVRFRDTRDVRDLQNLFERYRDARDPRDPLYRFDDVLDKYRLEDFYRKKEDFYERFRDPLDRHPDDRYKREERRREELYRQFFEDLQRRVDAERPVDCSVVVVNKQSKEYAESLGRKVRDLGMMVDLIFLNTEVSLTQALEDVSRGGSPFAIVITQQHQAHRSCTVNILFGTPQEHRNMPIADAMVLVARHYERFKTETREKEREDMARQAAKMSAEAVLKERCPPLEEGIRGPNPPGIMTLLGLIADNRYVTADEIDKVILYLRERKERLLAISADPLPAQLSRPSLGQTSAQSLDGSSTIASNQSHQMSQQMTQQLTSAATAAQTVSNSQQELQAKILSLFNSGAASTVNPNPPSTATASVSVQGQSYGNMSNSQQRASGQMDAASLGPPPQRSQPVMSQHPNSMVQGEAVRGAVPRPIQSPQMQGLYGQLPIRAQAPGSLPRPGVSTGINFDNPSVQKALDTLIQSGPALSHLVSQTAGQAVRSGPPQQQSMGSYPRHY